jgi:hypothetical protein
LYRYIEGKKGGAAKVPGYPSGFYSPHEVHGGERPVEVYHGGGLYTLNPVKPILRSSKAPGFSPWSICSGNLVSKFAFTFNVLPIHHGLRNPQSTRALADDDGMAERRAAPPGGNLDTNRPGASRPKLTRPRAADVFVRDELPPPGGAVHVDRI